jgi:hypothetical protein
MPPETEYSGFVLWKKWRMFCTGTNHRCPCMDILCVKTQRRDRAKMLVEFVANPLLAKF